MATAPGPVGPEDGRNREAEIVPCRSWAGTDAEAREPGLTLGPGAVRRSAAFVSGGSESGPDLQWPRRTQPRGGCGLASPGESCCLRLMALGTVAAVVEAVPGHSQIRITVFLFPRPGLSVVCAAMAPSGSLGFLTLDDHGGGRREWA